jgi:signal transduction histidine kinase
MSPRLRYSVLAVGVAVGLSAEYFSIDAHVPENHWLDLSVGWAYIGAGVVAWTRRPDSRMGMLMVLVGFTWFIGNFGNAGVPALLSLGAGFGIFNAAVLAHAVVGYPQGVTHDRVERAVVVGIYSWTVISGLAIAVTFDPRTYYDCLRCSTGGLAVLPSPSVYDTVNSMGNWAQGTFAMLVLCLVIRRLVRATPAARRILAPLWVAALLTATVFVLETVADSTVLETLQRVTMLLIPGVFLFGLLRGRFAQAAVAPLVLAMEGAVSDGRMREVLARALGDPTLQIAFPRHDQAGYVDEYGRPVKLPDRAGERSVTVLSTEGGGPLATLIHDPSLREQQPLIDAVGAAARMALENRRLHAEVLAQLTEVRASRARIVQATDAERRRVERDLHDGAQQRLVTLALALALARDRAGANHDTELATMLADASAQMGLAIDELRELARGIHPTILSEAGLGPALQSLAERCSIPTDCDCRLTERFDPAVEVTAFFVASEGLANAMKHSGASSIRLSADRLDGALVVSVTDNGVGGADPTAGSGLGGLTDRLAAVDGHLKIHSPAGDGTRLVAMIPCA